MGGLLSPADIFHSNTLIEELPRGGSTTRVLANLSGSSSGGRFSGVLGSNIYYFQNFCCLQRLGTAIGATPVQVASGVWPRSTVRDQNSLYFVELNTRNVYRYDAGTVNSLVPLITGNASEGAVFLDSTNVYLAVGALVRKVSKLGGSVTNIALPAGGVMRQADDAFIYFTVGTQLWRQSSTGSGLAEIVSSGISISGDMVSDADYLYWVDMSAGNGAGLINRLQKSASVSKIPVLLVHGWCGSPSNATWGEMKERFEAVGSRVDYARYPTNDEPHITRLAGHLSSEISRLLGDVNFNPSGSTQIDIIAHSMGGLATRALIAGLAVDLNGQAIPFGSNIRRLIEIATPNYGASPGAFSAFLISALNTPFDFSCPAANGALSGQIRDMEFGSQFIWNLEQHWARSTFAQTKTQDILTIVGTGGGLGGVGAGRWDGVVNIESATLSDSRIRARFINRKHGSDIAKVAGPDHETLLLARYFLSGSAPADPPVSACPSSMCKPIEDFPADTPGAVLIRLVDAQTVVDINPNRTGGALLRFQPLVGAEVRRSCHGRITRTIFCDWNPTTSGVTTYLQPNSYLGTAEVFARPRNILDLQTLYGPSMVSRYRIEIKPVRTTVLHESSPLSRPAR